MKTKQTRYIVMATLFLLLQTLGADAKEWESAAVKGIVAMNTGKGDEFVKITHKDFKKNLRGMITEMIRGIKDEAKKLNELKKFKVNSMEELEALGLDEFASTAINNMHHGSPAHMRKLLSGARYTAEGSVDKGDIKVVTVSVLLDPGVSKKNVDMTIFCKKEGGVWKYYGDPKSMPQK